MKNFKSSLVAGGMVGIGVIANITVENHYIGSLLFSLALLSVILHSFYLYTGKIEYALDRYVDTYSLPLGLIGNFIGIAAVVWSMAWANPDFLEALITVSNNKFSVGYGSIFIYGIFCGIMMYIAVYSKRELITVLCIMTFILCGFEHCVADFPLIFADFSWEKVVKLLLIIIGNSCGSILLWSLTKKKVR